MVTQIRITFVRHGETDYNKEGKIQGNMDIHLNQNGIEQAEKVSKKFLLENEPKVNLIISSSLSRAKQTAKTIHTNLENHYKSKIPFFETELLQERGMGIYQGDTFNNVKKELESLNLDYEMLPEPRFHHCWNHISTNENSKIETLKQVNKRVADSLQYILKTTMEQISNEKEVNSSSKSPYNVVVVSHGLFLCGVLGNLILSEEKWISLKHANTGVSSIILEVEEKDQLLHFKNPSILHLNDTSHHHFY